MLSCSNVRNKDGEGEEEEGKEEEEGEVQKW